MSGKGGVKTRRFWPLLVGAVLVTAAAVTVVIQSGGPAAPVVFAPASPLPDRTVQVEDFLGAEACAECHQPQYADWSTSTHGRAGGSPSEETLIAPFDGSPIVFADAVVTPRVTDEGDYEFVVRQLGLPERVYTVDGVIGGGHMVGGGTQGFVSRLADGTVRFLPFDWSATDRSWFCNTGTRLDQGWIPVRPEMSLADCGDWPPVRVLGTISRFGNCQGCHGSQITTSQRVGEPYTTDYTSLRINCESCHGPGTDHVTLARSGRMGFDGATGFRTLGTATKDGSLETCFQCHALKDVVKEGHLPGERLEDYYALKFPVLGEQPFFADSRVRTFAYQGTHLSSACYLQGSMTCVSCHAPHGQTYQDEFGTSLEGRFDDGQCTSCHASKALDVVAHTFHPAESDGSRCVSCHMPYLQQPDVGAGISYARSDHTIPVPRPEFDEGLGIQSACTLCHTDMSAEAAQQQAQEWWGSLKPHRPLVQAMVTEEGLAGSASGVDLLQPEQNDPLTQFAALGRFLTDHLEPDQLDLDADVEDRLLRLSESPDLDVRALALASLHWARGNERDVRAHLSDVLEAAKPDDQPLRQRWVLALSFLGDEARSQGGTARALLAFEKALELVPEDGRVWAAIGATHNQAGEYEQAIPYLERAVQADPDEALTYVNLGIALAATGDGAGASQSYATAATLNPSEALAFFNLGNLYLRQGSLAEAALSYERAVQLDPSLARGHYNLARAYIQLGRLDEALPTARRALEFEPENQGASQMLADLQRATGGG